MRVDADSHFALTGRLSIGKFHREPATGNSNCHEDPDEYQPECVRKEVRHLNADKRREKAFQNRLMISTFGAAHRQPELHQECDLNSAE